MKRICKWWALELVNSIIRVNKVIHNYLMNVWIFFTHSVCFLCMLWDVSLNGENSWSIISYSPTSNQIKCKEEFKSHNEIILRSLKIFHLSGKMKIIYWKWNQTHQLCSFSHISANTSISQAKTIHSWCIPPSKITLMAKEPMLKAVVFKVWRNWKVQEPKELCLKDNNNKNFKFHSRINWWK